MRHCDVPQAFGVQRFQTLTRFASLFHCYTEPGKHIYTKNAFIHN